MSLTKYGTSSNVVRKKLLVCLPFGKVNKMKFALSQFVRTCTPKVGKNEFKALGLTVNMFMEVHSIPKKANKFLNRHGILAAVYALHRTFSGHCTLHTQKCRFTMAVQK